MGQISLEHRYTYEELIESASILCQNYPDIMREYTIGNTWDNRVIKGYEIGNGKKSIVLTSGVHGRESVNPIILLKIFETYLEYGNGKKERNSLWEKLTTYPVKKILEQFTFLLIPVLNPDGYEIARGGYGQIRNRFLRKRLLQWRIPAAEWKYNARGIDINRNFPCVSYVPLRRGDRPASEPETKALMEVFRMIESVGYLDYHSRGKMIYYYRKAMPASYNQNQYAFALELQSLCGYTLVPPADEMDEVGAGGNTVHYYSETYGKSAITIETVEEQEEFPLSLECQESTFLENLLIPLQFAILLEDGGELKREFSASDVIKKEEKREEQKTELTECECQKK